MSLPDLDIIALPDLTGPDYPEADHEPTCVDTILDPKPCWPAGLTALYRVRPYMHPTEPLGRIRFPWMRIRNLFPVPPSIGVHCGTVTSTQTDIVQGGPGTPPDFDRDVEQPVDDSCRVNIRDVITLPCILPSYGVGEVRMLNNTVGETTVAVVPNGTCGHIATINIELDDLTGGNINIDATVVGFNFIVGNATPVYDWGTSFACADSDEACAYPPGADVVILTDVDGIIVPAGSQIGSGAPGSGIEVENGDNEPMFCGDRVKLVKISDGGSGGTDSWKAYKV